MRYWYCDNFEGSSEIMQMCRLDRPFAVCILPNLPFELAHEILLFIALSSIGLFMNMSYLETKSIHQHYNAQRCDSLKIACAGSNGKFGKMRA